MLISIMKEKLHAHFQIKKTKYDFKQIAPDCDLISYSCNEELFGDPSEIADLILMAQRDASNLYYLLKKGENHVG